MKKSLISAIFITGVILLVGGYYFARQSQTNEVLPSSVTSQMEQELREGDELGASDAALEQDATSIGEGTGASSAPSGSANLFMSEEAQLDAEISNLETDMNQLNAQDANGDIQDLEQIQ